MIDVRKQRPRPEYASSRRRLVARTVCNSRASRAPVGLARSAARLVAFQVGHANWRRVRPASSSGRASGGTASAPLPGMKAPTLAGGCCRHPAGGHPSTYTLGVRPTDSPRYPHARAARGVAPHTTPTVTAVRRPPPPAKSPRRPPRRHLARSPLSAAGYRPRPSSSRARARGTGRTRRAA